MYPLLYYYYCIIYFFIILLVIIASEASFLVSSMARIFYIIITVSGSMSCSKRSKYFNVYLNIRPIPLCKYKRATRKHNRLNELAQYTIAAAYLEQAFARPLLLIIIRLYRVGCAVNGLRVSKYPPNAIFRNANINAQRRYAQT